ncbi:hypothetical protein VNO77_42014 [Canavalia gladiata]|uniref:Uncharacterized protein n=1 Tax=Canavalia gladiata TaxID=3824 RepID=A0AAN9K3C4_CANGL
MLRNSLQVLLTSNPNTDKVNFLFDLHFHYSILFSILISISYLFYFHPYFANSIHFNVMLPWTLMLVPSVTLLASKPYLFPGEIGVRAMNEEDEVGKIEEENK